MEGKGIVSQGRAVLIGVNAAPSGASLNRLNYAEHDAQEMAAVLSDSVTGTFDPLHVRLLTGAQATAETVKRTLREAAIGCPAGEPLLIYYAGHAMLPPDGTGADPFLILYDSNVPDLQKHPDQGLRMGYLRRDVFGSTKGQSLLLLDCCHAGAYRDVESDDGFQAAMVSPKLRELTGFGALLACPKDAGTRERADVRHGLITDQILRGLRGEAAGVDGEVTFQSLSNFIQDLQLHPSPRVITDLSGPTILLTRRSLPSTDLGRRPPYAAVTPSANPLEQSAKTLLGVLSRTFQHGDWPPPTDAANELRARAELVKSITGGEAAGVVKITSRSEPVEVATGSFPYDTVSRVVRDTAAHLSLTNRINHAGYVCRDAADRVILTVPLEPDRGNGFKALVVVNPSESAMALGEPGATALAALWRLRADCPPRDAEFAVLTELKRGYGRLPGALYEHASRLYSDIVNEFVTVFEPIMALGSTKSNVGIFAWEALARRKEFDQRAPVELLDAAHVWGEHFVVERDSILGSKALRSYAEAHSRSPRATHDGPRPISINVSIRSLLSHRYVDEFRDAIADVGLDTQAVTLEISERDPIEPPPHEVWETNRPGHFQGVLKNLVNNLGVNVAIDDFGVGHASLDWLSTLTLTHIKIDRAILFHPLALDEIRLVVKVAADCAKHSNWPARRNVVMEGFDDHSPLSLRDLYTAGIRLVQGYITGPPATGELPELENDLRSWVAEQIGSTE